ncbi:hypothetical protein dsx2_1330 [Desulfovibrio sp. X2]|uniref:amphi-Trp domain-containing protein n=1 Tax=Desulfovibrio sp. X2 TaxID=941449 RepID=UPI000358A140|nr:amphi-Trp domain-containing protein [Desulfovibrio sp. X2]EPR44702.1 hypothetical protein dsx2_1330 [Desulfovibrio sp. X2]
MSKSKVKIDSVMELSRVVATLEDVLASFKAGTLHVSLGDDAVTLVPPTVVDFEMELESKKDKAKINIEISWRADRKGAAASDMTIATQEPGMKIG